MSKKIVVLSILIISSSRIDLVKKYINAFFPSIYFILSFWYWSSLGYVCVGSVCTWGNSGQCPGREGRGGYGRKQISEEKEKTQTKSEKKKIPPIETETETKILILI